VTKTPRKISVWTRTRGYSRRYAPNTPLIAPDAPTIGMADDGLITTWVAAAATPHNR